LQFSGRGIIPVNQHSYFRIIFKRFVFLHCFRSIKRVFPLFFYEKFIDGIIPGFMEIVKIILFNKLTEEPRRQVQISGETGSCAKVRG
jgi:hypothetical protein